MILVTYALLATLTRSTASAVPGRQNVSQQVYVQVIGNPGVVDPYGVLGPGDLITGGRVLRAGLSRHASTANPVTTISPGDLGSLGLTLPARGAPPPPSTDLRITLGPGDLVTGGTRPAARR
jgi:hypothetical protein